MRIVWSLHAHAYETYLTGYDLVGFSMRVRSDVHVVTQEILKKFMNTLHMKRLRRTGISSHASSNMDYLYDRLFII